MTSLRPFATPLLEVQAAEDSMELSSDIDRVPVHDDLDLDVDVDVDALSEQLLDPDDDYMIEDAHSATGDGAHLMIEAVNDDVMHDQDRASPAMDDDIVVPDGDIGDADDTTQHAAYDTDFHAFDLNTVLVDETNDVPADGASYPDGGENHLGLANKPDPDHFHALSSVAPKQDLTEGSSLTDVPVPLPEPPAREVADVEATTENHNDGAAGDTDPLLADTDEPLPTNLGGEAAEIVDVDVQTGELLETHGENEASHLHPVVVAYEGSEVSLFPPSKDDASDTFFLHDETLASQPMGELFHSLRSILAESINEDDELEVSVEDLGVFLSEDSHHAHVVTLAQILDLHVHLARLDGAEQPGPLYMSLTTRIRLPRRLEDLATAVSEGKGLSQLALWGREVTAHPPVEESGSAGGLERTSDDSAAHQDEPIPPTQRHEDHPEPTLETVSPEPSPPEASDLRDPEDAEHPSGLPTIDRNTSLPPTLAPETLGSIAPDGTSPHRVQSPEEAPHAAKVQTESAENAENGDLIDYEQDEIERGDGDGTEVSRSATTDSATLQGDELGDRNAEYAAQNEAESRRSSLRSAAGSLDKASPATDVTGSGRDPVGENHDASDEASDPADGWAEQPPESGNGGYPSEDVYDPSYPVNDGDGHGELGGEDEPGLEDDYDPAPTELGNDPDGPEIALDAPDELDDEDPAHAIDLVDEVLRENGTLDEQARDDDLVEDEEAVLDDAAAGGQDDVDDVDDVDDEGDDHPDDEPPLADPDISHAELSQTLVDDSVAEFDDEAAYDPIELLDAELDAPFLVEEETHPMKRSRDDADGVVSEADSQDNKRARAS
ncbi:MAG: hypothetical protein M1838_000587 [Thelocarpon superellum]|nr:MAG: hypothetical protein M1838_000587 [Thelocarpon superellum]